MTHIKEDNPLANFADTLPFNNASVEFHNKKKYISFLKFKINFQKYGLEKVRTYEVLLYWLKSPMAVTGAAIVDPWQLLPEVIKIFDDTGVWHLPVVDENNRFIGFISKSTIPASYRQLLKEYPAG